MSDERTFVIVGASMAGAQAAQQLRGDGFAGRIVLVGEDLERPYERPPLSKGYLLGKEPREKAFIHDAGWYAEHQVELLLGVRATAVDPGAHTVTLEGYETVGYDKLLLATGSHVRRLDIAGSENRGVHYLRTMADAEALNDAITGDRQVVVIGAGWIGLEVAAAARARGAGVTVVEQDRLPLHRVLGDELGTVLAALHEAHGVDLRLGVGLREFGDVGGQLSHVVLADGSEIAADVAVVGVGIRPATELAEAAGLTVDNGVVADATLCSSDPDIFVAGDVASFTHPVLNKRIRVEHWANARYGGRIAGKNMLGQRVPFDRLPYFFSDQYDLSLEYSGYVEPRGYDQLVFRGDPAMRGGKAPEFLAFWLKGGCVLAGMNVNTWDVQDDIIALVKAGYSGHAVDPDRLANPDVPLADLTA